LLEVHVPEDPSGTVASAETKASGLAARQEALVRALTGAGSSLSSPPADGFDPVRIACAAEALVDKRTRSAARGWPALATALGEEFRPLFREFASASPIPPGGTPLEDGYAFAEHLARSGHFPKGARLELLLARWRLRGGWPLHVGMLRRPARLVFAVRLPRRGLRWWVFGAG
jgi:hypothetical protein